MFPFYIVSRLEVPGELVEEQNIHPDSSPGGNGFQYQMGAVSTARCILNGLFRKTSGNKVALRVACCLTDFPKTGKFQIPVATVTGAS